MSSSPAPARSASRPPSNWPVAESTSESSTRSTILRCTPKPLVYLMQRFIMRWRIWSSHRLIDDWLGDYAYFRRQFFRRPNDNPDQRIQQDIDIFTTGAGGQTNNPAYGSSSTLLFGAVAAVLSVVSFGCDHVASFRALDARQHDNSPRTLLDRHRLRAGRHRHRLRHRPAPDPVELPQRTSQCRLPLRVGAGEGCQRRHRLVPGRDRRASSARRAALGGDGELRELAEPHGAIHRLESDREPGDQPAALRRAGATAFRRPDFVRRCHTVGHRVRHDPQRAVVFSGRHTTSSRATERQ